MSNKITTPIAANQGLQCTVTPPWFVQKSEYSPLNGTFDFLINGERAFAEVHRAIALAKKSVYIICWGFQPSMYFVRKGAENIRYDELPEAVPAQIGKLLEYKARNNVQVKVLCYAFEDIPARAATMAREVSKGAGGGVAGAVAGAAKGAATDDKTYINVTGVKAGLGESNTPGRHNRRLSDQPSTSTDQMQEYDIAWYERYDRKQEKADMARNAKQAKSDVTMQNLQFYSRDFTAQDRQFLLAHDYTDKHVSRTMRYVLAGTPSHHQKTVLVDIESPKDHLAFVMGHNMLDAYWDTSAHSIQKRKPHTPWLGPNGLLPRQDLSSRLSGPACGDVYRNFLQAWQQAAGQALPKIDTRRYPLHDKRGQALQCQIVRTQQQVRSQGRAVEDIKQVYLQAVNNATRSIYIENQYFRWPPLADAICKAAQDQTSCGRDPGQHGSLHLFVVTNSSDDGMGSGTLKSYQMLDKLGRADTIPGVARTKRIENLDASIRQAQGQARRTGIGLPNPVLYPGGKYPPAWQKQAEKYHQATQKVQGLKRQRDELADKSKQAHEVIRPEEVPGLKVHICTLVPPDTPPSPDSYYVEMVYPMTTRRVKREGKQWQEVYIHSKLMIVNDTFMTLGSSNINTRSMQVDSELNLVHCNPQVARKARLDLWNIHTAGKGAQADVGEAFKSWEKIISENKRRETDRVLPPYASLRGFLRTDPSISDKD
ncbi:hypothetical protein ACG97_08360 [Vogesella sp. EB]|uniref:Phospholipase D-like protein n=1 Tax=Vogesella indigofera TaxID=45465 RepID=A0A495BNB6_VOGIN|nr:MULTISPECIES: phospholipase D-like domain-containing protein [Vogesella]KMJ53312.1 hypothetical protein ACG97_08360 [Vogesella sp. EB]RKQ63138.1 phospholipase D-like protein [Vogesella indigofera]